MAGRRAAGEGSLFQRQKGRHAGKWVARLQVGVGQNGKPRRKDFLFPTQAAAKAKLRQSITDLERGREPISKTQRLGAYLDYWLENRAKPKVAPNTYDRYRSTIAVHIKPDPISQLQISEVKQRHVNDLLGRSAAGRTKGKPGARPYTLTNIRAVLSAALQQAVKEDLIYENPVAKSDSPKQGHRRLKFLNKEDARKLIEVSRGNVLEPMLLSAILTGMRLSELIGLTWDRVDFDNKTLKVDRQLQRHDGKFYFAPLKRGTGRTMPMAPAVVEQFKALKAASLLRESTLADGLEDLIFVTPEGMPFHRKTVLDWTKGLMKRSNVAVLDFHTLRHTCASILINAGADVLQVQRQLGHANVRVTLMTYSHLFEERLHHNNDLLTKALNL